MTAIETDLPKIVESQATLTGIVLRAMANTDNPRLAEIMRSLVTHLHDFAREVRLSEAEFDTGIDFLNRIGQATNDSHNEGILMSDALGFSTLICLLNNGDDGATETDAALLGPFWRMNSPRTENGGSIVRCSTPGAALFADITVVDEAGQPIEGVDVDVWQASTVGLYENQDADQAHMNLRGKFTTGADGKVTFRSVKPAGYPVPTDGPTGDLLRAQNRHPYRPAHVHLLGFKEGYKTLITQIFVDKDSNLETDVVFGVTRALVGDFQEGQGPAPDGTDGPWYRLEHRLTMKPGEALLPVPPIK